MIKSKILFTKMTNLGRNARGQAMVTNLAAIAIVTTAAAGTASLVQYLVSQSKKSQVLNRAVVLQSEINASLIRKDQYQKGGAGRTKMKAADLAQIKAIRAGGSAVGFALKSATGQDVAVVGRKLGFDFDGAACTKDCAVYVDFDIRCTGSTSTGCMAAYRVTPTASSGNTQTPPLGAPPHEDPNVRCDAGVVGFDCADYIVPLGEDFMIEDTKPKCAADDVMITGLNRATGDLQCVKRGAAECPDGYIAHGVKAVPGTGVTRLELACHPLARAGCPANYVLERLAVNQLDLGKGFTGNYAGYAPPDGLCRYRWRNNIPWQTPLERFDSSYGESTATTVVCNPNIYDARSPGGCGYQVTQSSPGTCGLNSVVTVQPIQIQGGQVSCTIRIMPQCGSTMTAHPTATGTCEVKEPYRSNITVQPSWQ